MIKNIYIDLNPLLNTSAWLRMAITERGDGKTTALNCHAFREALNDRYKRVSILLRRYKNEMGTAWRNDVINKIKEFVPEAKDMKLQWIGSLSSNNSSGLWLIDKRDGRPFIQAFPITIAPRLNSGIDVKSHINIFWDEYVPHDGRYYPKEETILFSLYQAVDRKTYTKKILICGNPRFGSPRILSYLGVKASFNKTALKLFKNDTLALLTRVNAGNTAAVLQSPFAALLEGTEFDEEIRGNGLGFRNFPVWKGKRSSPNFFFLTSLDGIYARADLFPEQIVLSVTDISKIPSNALIYSVTPTFNSVRIKYIATDKAVRTYFRRILQGRGISFMSYDDGERLALFSLSLLKFQR